MRNNIYHYHLDIDGYNDGGLGNCENDRGQYLPAASFLSSNIKDCKFECDNQILCVAFDVSPVNEIKYCNLRFISSKYARDVAASTGYSFYSGNCGDTCGSGIAGKPIGDKNGRCYVKIQGTSIHRPTYMDLNYLMFEIFKSKRDYRIY